MKEHCKAPGVYHMLDKYELLLTLIQMTWQEVCSPFGLISNTGDSEENQRK